MNRALWHVSATESELQTVQTPTDPDLVAVESLYSSISVGSERLVATGKAARPGAPFDAPYVEGDFGFPIKYGYSLVGRDAQGRIVHCLHPHQSTAFVSQQACFALGASLDSRRAALLSNMETVLNAIWDARLERAHDVLLCGFGGIGALLANTLRLSNGIRPTVVETDAWRREKARALGFEAFSPDNLNTSFARIIHSSSSADGLQFCIDHCSLNGRIVELSWYGTRPVQLELGTGFHRNRVRLISSQVSAIPVHMSDAVSIESRKQLASDLLVDTSYDELISNEIPFEESPAFFDDLRHGREGNGLIWLIRY